jgi:hypothetical protein
MSFEILRRKKPSCSGAAMAAIILLSFLLLGVGIAFAWLLISGEGNNYLLGTLMSFEFLVAGMSVVLYARSFSAFREVSEDREEELLW